MPGLTPQAPASPLDSAIPPPNRNSCMPSLPPVTQALLLINIAAFCIDYMLGGLLTRWFALYPVGSGYFYPWQIVTYAFLHSLDNLFHLFFNMLGLWMFGSDLERLWGQKRYIQYYAASLLAAAVIQLIVNYLIGGGPTVGASGALFGLLLAFGMMFPNRMIMPLFPPIPMKAKIFVAIFGALELFLGVTGTQQGVAHFAHLGGMLGGFLMIRYWQGRSPFGR
jgi:membrane associated rhomboid family serine protease